jgi:nucleoside-diphosphate-sugar epimerase
VSSPAGLNTSMAVFSGALQHLEHAKGPDAFTGFLGNLADVRDVADAHVEALLNKDASGKRLVIATKPMIYQDLGMSSLLLLIFSIDLLTNAYS